MRRVCAAALAVLLLLFSSGCGGTERADAPLSYRISNAAEVVASIRRGLKNHAKTVTVTFSYGEDIFDELNGVIDDWVEAALAETDEPDEGDYIRYQYGGYTYTSSRTEENGRLYYTVKLTPSYYCYLSQEEEASAAAKELLRDFRFRPWTSDYEKLRTVYDWLCRNVTYDKIHRKNPYYHLCSTAYAALVQHTAACQGYCAALYRLLREAGIACRIVTGPAVSENGASEKLHAWVIAELDGLWYGLDPTWDAGGAEYRFFLAGEEAFADHIPGERFRTEDFRRTYPMAEHSYYLSE